MITLTIKYFHGLKCTSTADYVYCIAVPRLLNIFKMHCLPSSSHLIMKWSVVGVAVYFSLSSAFMEEFHVQLTQTRTPAQLPRACTHGWLEEDGAATHGSPVSLTPNIPLGSSTFSP
jgi:hypothetical protein